MSLFPFVIGTFSAVAGLMWCNLDSLGQLLGKKEVPLCVPPYEAKWLPWKSGVVEEKLAQGETVLLFFTAQWDLTALVNENRWMQDESVLEELERHRVVMIKADNTLRDPLVEQEMKKFDVIVLPLAVVLRGEDGDQQVLLSELVTPEALIAALRQVAQN